MTVSLAEVVQIAAQAQAEEMHTSTIGRVVKYYPADQTADIELCISRPLSSVNGEVVYEKLGTIGKVPVQFPRVKKYSITFPLEAGDTGTILFTENSIAEWRAGAKQGEPAFVGRHGSGSCIFQPGVYPDKVNSVNATNAALTMGAEATDSKIEITESGIFLGHGATDWIALSSKVDAALKAITDKYDAHTHPFTAVLASGGSPAPGTTSATAATAGTQPTVASSLVKSK